jgi:hypothetical protein
MHPDPFFAPDICLPDRFENTTPSFNPGGRFRIPWGDDPDTCLIKPEKKII